MKRIITYEITNPYKNIHDFLKARGYSHPIMVQLKKTPDAILKNNHWAYVREPLNTGDELTITLNEEDSSPNIVPTNIPIDIVYEDEDILLVNKPALLPIHPSQNHYEDTLANGIMYYYQSKHQPFIFRCMNRLDRDTSGLTLIAKNALSSAILNTQVKTKTLQRTYLCIATGEMTGNGCINAPIGRVQGSTIERQIDFENGKNAITNYQVLKSQNGYSLVSLQLETGRTHQIRVHMKSIGHPLPGDFLYNPDYSIINRQALHSYALDFIHPITKEAMHFTAKLPDDMSHIINI